MNLLKHSDAWYIDKMGEDWLLKRDLVELIIHIELENLDLVDALFKRFHRKYKRHIVDSGRLKRFLNIARTIHQKDNKERITPFRESELAQLSEQLDDIFMLSFYAWVVARYNKQSLYSATLDLL